MYHTTEPDLISEYRTFTSMNEFSNKEGIISENGQDYILIGSNPKQKSNINDILQKVYEYSVSKGANGVTNMKYTTLQDKTIEISGTLIKLEK